MNEKNNSSKPPKPTAEEKAIATPKDPTVCELCGATSEHVEIVPVGPLEGRPQYRGICAPHYSLLAWLVKEIIYDAFFSEGLEVFQKRYQGGQ